MGDSIARREVAPPQGSACGDFDRSKLRLATVYFDLDGVIHLARRAAATVPPHVPSPLPFHVDQAARVDSHMAKSLPIPQVGRIVMVVVADRPHVLREVGLVRNLDHDIVANAGLRIVVPERDGVDLVLAP